MVRDQCGSSIDVWGQCQQCQTDVHSPTVTCCHSQTIAVSSGCDPEVFHRHRASQPYPVAMLTQYQPQQRPLTEEGVSLGAVGTVWGVSCRHDNCALSHQGLWFHFGILPPAACVASHYDYFHGCKYPG